MHEIIGDFIKTFPPENDSLELNFTPDSERIKHRWRNQRLSAHFVADYFTNFLPFESKDSEDKERIIKETKGAVSFVANELLENAMKFNLQDTRHRVRFGIHFLENSETLAVIFATNFVDIQGAKKLQDFIQKLQDSDPQEFYIEQIEASAQDENSDISGLGFLTMINDYQARLGWRFETIQSKPTIIIAVTSMAQVSV